MAERLWTLLQENLRQELNPEEFDTWFAPLRVSSENGDQLVLSAPDVRWLNTIEESYRPVVDRAAANTEPPIRVSFTLDEFKIRDRKPPTAANTSPFSPKYRFESFVVGSSNQFAHAAARAVADNPFRSYNPLFLYGGVGLGKTHLLHAIGHRLSETRPDLEIRYLQTEQFVNDLISSIRHNRMPDFRERHRNIDILLVDDVQFLAGKERTQEEFFHTFNTLHGAGRQIILSSDHAPREIPTLEERLRSRFEWGLIADIQSPDLETKMAILRRKAEIEGTDLPDEVAAFIAQQVKSNVRELEGLLNRVRAHAELTGQRLSIAFAKETLYDILPPDRRVNPNDIVRYVAHHYGLKVAEIKARSNSRQIVFPRQVAMYLAKKLTDLSYPDIGKLFGKHHTTVIHSVEKIEQARTTDHDLDRLLEVMIEHFS